VLDFELEPAVARVPVTTSVKVEPDPVRGEDHVTVNALVSIARARDTAPLERIERKARPVIPKGGAGKPSKAAVLEAGNSRITISVDETDRIGEFILATADGRPLLYPGFYSGAAGILVDGESFVFGGEGGVWLVPVHVSGNVITGVWERDDIRVTMTLAIVRNTATGDFDAVEIGYELANAGPSPRDVGFYRMLDLYVGDEDRVPVSAGDRCNMDEREFYGEDVPDFWQAFETPPGKAGEGLVVRGVLSGNGAVKPDRFVVGEWSRLMDDGRGYSPSGEYSDCAVGMWWDPTTLPPGGRRRVSTVLGLGEAESFTGDLTLVLSGERELARHGDGLAPNPFQVTAVVVNESGMDVTDVMAGIRLPGELRLKDGDPPVKPLGTLSAGETVQVGWLVIAPEGETDETYVYSVALTGSAAGTSRIAGDMSVFVPGRAGCAAHVSSAEVFVDTDPGEGNGSVMHALDGSFDGVSERVTAVVETNDLCPGVHTVFVRGMDSNGVWGEPAAYLFDHAPAEEGAYIEIDADGAAPGSQGKTVLYNTAGGEKVCFAVYLHGNESMRGFKIDLKWDDEKAAFVPGLSGPHIPDGEWDVNGLSGVVLTAEENILLSGGGAMASVPEADAPGRHAVTWAKMGGGAVTAEDGLLYFAVFRMADDFAAERGFSVRVDVSVYDDCGGETKLGAGLFNITADAWEPPTDVTVSDIPGDNGHSLLLRWTPSVDDALITHYNIYRSRSPVLTVPVSLETFGTIDELIEAEETATILIASVPRGSDTYIDPYVPLAGKLYYYWVEAASESGASEKIAAGCPAAVCGEQGGFLVDEPYPNPFNSAVTIRYTLGAARRVRLVVYDILGREVATIADEYLDAGVHHATWNGRDRNGNAAAAGIYLFTFEAGAFAVGGKILLLR